MQSPELTPSPEFPVPAGEVVEGDLDPFEVEVEVGRGVATIPV